MATPTQLSHKRSILTINGEQVTGFAEGESPISIEGQDLVTTTFGSDGTLYVTDTAVQGGEITLTLGQSSPWIPTAVAYNTRVKRGEKISFDLTYGDPSLGYSVNARGGFLVSSGVTTMPGANFEAKFVFEQIIGDMDGVSFSPPPVAT